MATNSGPLLFHYRQVSLHYTSVEAQLFLILECVNIMLCYALKWNRNELSLFVYTFRLIKICQLDVLNLRIKEAASFHTEVRCHASSFTSLPSMAFYF
jgi:hypothetical protein